MAAAVAAAAAAAAEIVATTEPEVTRSSGLHLAGRGYKSFLQAI